MCNKNCDKCEECMYKKYYDSVKKSTSKNQKLVREEYLKKGICFICKTNPVKKTSKGKPCTLCEECMEKQKKASSKYYNKEK